ncbi:MAG: class E sortase [bacterium]
MLISAGVLMRRIPKVWDAAAIVVGREAAQALSAALIVCGTFVMLGPWAWVAGTGRAVYAAQSQALSAWDQAVARPAPSVGLQSPHGGPMVLSLPTLSLRRFVPNDATPDHLKAYGVGWIPWTALPGADGVVGIAGHRTTHGAPFFWLDRLTEGDPIVIDYRGHRYTYRVERVETVSPTQVQVLEAPPDRRMIALVTCTPAYSAAYRLVVLGRLDTVAAWGNGQ